MVLLIGFYYLWHGDEIQILQQSIQMLTNQQKLHSLLKSKGPSNKERQQILKLIRNGQYDLPECVFDNAYTLLKNNSSASDLKYKHTNDLIYAGLELNIGSKLKAYLQKFKQALGDVPYVKKLTTFIDFIVSQEPTDDYFGELIVQDRTNYDSKKQSLTALKVLYQWEDYVEKINRYLQENPNDIEAWIELGDMYTQKSQYLRALFCYEEVILLSPDNDYYFIRLAQLYYTDGGKANLAIAVKYYCHVISRNPYNARALWGLWRSLHAQKDNLQDHDKQLMEFVSDSISKLYNKKNPSIKIHLAL